MKGGDKENEKCPKGWGRSAVSYGKLLQRGNKNQGLPQIWIFMCNPVIFKKMQPIFKKLFKHKMSQMKHICGP